MRLWHLHLILALAGFGATLLPRVVAAPTADIRAQCAAQRAAKNDFDRAVCADYL